MSGPAQPQLVPDGGAAFDPARHYRYRLWRQVAPGDRRLLFVMLNPSTADEGTDDQTIRRCMSFARREGAGWLDVVNLFAWRATDPRELLRVEDPVGPANDEHIAAAAREAGQVVVAWGGVRVRWYARMWDVLDLLRAHHWSGRVWCLGRTAHGWPRHPSRLPGGASLEQYVPSR